jgi:hypothetical protein
LTLGMVPQRKHLRRKTQGMELRDELKGFHDSLAFNGNCFLPMGRQHSRIPFCQVELQQIWRPLFSGMGNWLFLMTLMVTTPQSQVIAHGTTILWPSKLFFPRGTATTPCNPGPLLGISWDNKLRMVN